MRIDIRLSGSDLARFGFVAEPTRSTPQRLMALEGGLDVMFHDTLANLLDGGQQFVATVAAQIDREARAADEAAAASAEIAQHNAAHCGVDCPHVLPLTDLYLDDSAAAGTAP